MATEQIKNTTRAFFVLSMLIAPLSPAARELPSSEVVQEALGLEVINGIAQAEAHAPADSSSDDEGESSGGGNRIIESATNIIVSPVMNFGAFDDDDEDEDDDETIEGFFDVETISGHLRTVINLMKNVEGFAHKVEWATEVAERIINSFRDVDQRIATYNSTARNMTPEQKKELLDAILLGIRNVAKDTILFLLPLMHNPVLFPVVAPIVHSFVVIALLTYKPIFNTVIAKPTKAAVRVIKSVGRRIGRFFGFGSNETEVERESNPLPAIELPPITSIQARIREVEREQQLALEEGSPQIVECSSSDVEAEGEYSQSSQSAQEEEAEERQVRVGRRRKKVKRSRDRQKENA